MIVFDYIFIDKITLLLVFGLSLLIISFSFAFNEKEDILRNITVAFFFPLIMSIAYFLVPADYELALVHLTVACLPPLMLAFIWRFHNFSYFTFIVMQIILASLILWLMQTPQLSSWVLRWDHFFVLATLLVSVGSVIHMWKNNTSYWLIGSLLAFISTQVALMTNQPLLYSVAISLAFGLFFTFILKKLQQELTHIIQKADVGSSQWDRTVRQEVMMRTLEIERVNRHLAESIRTDPLTGLLNKKAIVEEIKLSIDQCRNSSFTLILFDIDDFKSINDQQGHLAGDRILSQVAGIALSSIRNRDRVGRYGGDEFIILLPNTSLKDAYYVGKRLLERAAKDLSCTLSLGIAVYPVDGQTADDLISRADQGLYEAKHQGKNCMAYNGGAQ